MSRRFFELAVRARRYVARTTNPSRAPRGPRPTARRQLGQSGGELTQFSFRLALVIDLAYVGIGALGGAAVGRASAPGAPPAAAAPQCRPPFPSDSTTTAVSTAPNAGMPSAWPVDTPAATAVMR
jgi:hypothetical protein